MNGPNRPDRWRIDMNEQEQLKQLKEEYENMDSHYSVLNNIVFGGRKNVSDESKRNHGSDPT